MVLNLKSRFSPWFTKVIQSPNTRFLYIYSYCCQSIDHSIRVHGPPVSMGTRRSAILPLAVPVIDIEFVRVYAGNINMEEIPERTLLSTFDPVRGQNGPLLKAVARRSNQ